jgi:hypothetical protein
MPIVLVAEQSLTITNLSRVVPMVAMNTGIAYVQFGILIVL